MEIKLKHIFPVALLFLITAGNCHHTEEDVKEILESTVNGSLELGFEGCESKAYPPDPKTKVPTYIIDLDLPPEQRWTKLMTDKKKGVIALIKNIKDLVTGLFGSKIVKFVDIYFPYLARTLQDPYYDELRGIAEATNITLGEITLYNVFYEIFTVCTSIIVEDQNGKLYHGRNLDFGLFMGWDDKNHTWITTELLRPLVIKLEFQKKKTTVYRSISYAGYIGVLTAVKPQKFTLSVDERFKLNGGYIGLAEWILGFHNQKWMGFLTREVMESAISYKQAQKMLAKSKIIAPAYFILGGNKTGQGSIITRGRNNFDILSLGHTSVGQTGKWYLLETNFDHWRRAPFFDNRRTPAIRCLEQAGQNSSFPGALYNVLSTKPVLNKLTTYTALMDVSAGTVDAWIQNCKGPCSPW